MVSSKMPTAETSVIVALVAAAWVVGRICFGVAHRWKGRWRRASFTRGIERFILNRKPLFQPVPDVTPDDVRRIVNREFQSGQVGAAMEALNEPINARPSSPRVQLAVLKLANGDIGRLRTWVKTAQRDYRDVLVPAEYPAYNRARQSNRNMSIKEHNAAVESDWRQYEERLRK